MVTGEILLVMFLALVARFMIPKMMYSESTGIRFALGCTLFAMYNVSCVAFVRYLCCCSYSGGHKIDIAMLSGSEVWGRVVCAILILSVSVLFVACIFFFTRDKRTLSQKEKMKLKDL